MIADELRRELLRGVGFAFIVDDVDLQRTPVHAAGALISVFGDHERVAFRLAERRVRPEIERIAPMTTGFARGRGGAADATTSESATAAAAKRNERIKRRPSTEYRR